MVLDRLESKECMIVALQCRCPGCYGRLNAISTRVGVVVLFGCVFSPQTKQVRRSSLQCDLWQVLTYSYLHGKDILSNGFAVTRHYDFPAHSVQSRHSWLLHDDILLRRSAKRRRPVRLRPSYTAGCLFLIHICHCCCFVVCCFCC